MLDAAAEISRLVALSVGVRWRRARFLAVSVILTDSIGVGVTGTVPEWSDLREEMVGIQEGEGALLQEFYS
jgi:hypothetical protein